MGIETECLPNVKIKNGKFTSPDDWIKGINWTIAGGVAVNVENGNPPDGYLKQIIIGQNLHTYRVKLEIKAINININNEFRVRIFDQATSANAVGNYVLYFTIVDSEPFFWDGLFFYLRFPAFVGDTVTIDNVEIMDITQQCLCVYGFDPRLHSKYELLDLGGGLFNLTVANRIDHSNTLMAINANLF